MFLTLGTSSLFSAALSLPTHNVLCSFLYNQIVYGFQTGSSAHSNHARFEVSAPALTLNLALSYALLYLLRPPPSLN